MYLILMDIASVCDVYIVNKVFLKDMLHSNMVVSG